MAVSHLPVIRTQAGDILPPLLLARLRMVSSLSADQNYSTALGQYNLSNRTGTILVVGNGTAESLRSNIFEIDAGGGLINGDFAISGSITANGVDLVDEIVVLVDENAALSNSMIALETEISTLDTMILNLQGIVADLQTQINLLTP